MQALKDQTLNVNLSRVNARGVLRPTETGAKVLIGLIAGSPLNAPVSPKAMRDMLGLSAVVGDIVLVAPRSGA